MYYLAKYLYSQNYMYLPSTGKICIDTNPVGKICVSNKLCREQYI